MPDTVWLQRRVDELEQMLEVSERKVDILKNLLEEAWSELKRTPAYSGYRELYEDSQRSGVSHESGREIPGSK